MIETSGHGAMRENYCLDDGAYIAVKIVIEAVDDAPRAAAASATCSRSSRSRWRSARCG